MKMLSETIFPYQSIIILVFKTNASSNINQRLVASLFEYEKGVKTWNFDFEDCDNIFRVESSGIAAEEIIQKLATINIIAEELED